ncbi:helix-turn-helix transcriptional regulator [Nocardioides astragali]|uniref:LuxR C-terminal-related transcriptional regulator n=1 Tax=Nocardioides astragali TaxID=1776736 RepID=A0ABW2N4I4_9ACTN|nr:LuxR family transcriptional regulator [Nocardioides astragali]
MRDIPLAVADVPPLAASSAYGTSASTAIVAPDRRDVRSINPVTVLGVFNDLAPGPGPDVSPALSGSGTGLVGRHRECAVLDGLVSSVRGGESKVLALRGEAGIGKSALLDYVAGNAGGCRVLRIAGIESEMELAFAGLHRLCAPMLEHLERIPEPQSEALAVAFGVAVGTTPDRFLVAIGVMSMLAEAAGEQPLVCLVDNADKLDQASARTLGFVARRLKDQAIGLVLVTHDEDDQPALTGLDELVVHGLDHEESELLLDSILRGPVDAKVRSRIIGEARGNPRALLGLPHQSGGAGLSFGFGTSGVSALPTRLEQDFQRRLGLLAPETRRLLLVAALEPAGDVTMLWRAARGLGIGSEAAVAARAAGLIEIGPQVRFCHPLVRVAVCRTASREEFREAHHALSDATDADLDPDLRAWHRAHAVTSPHDEVATELERSADRARTRGGVAAAAAFLERAAELAGDPQRAGRLGLIAAQARHRAGASEAALGLLAMVEAWPLESAQRAQVEVVRAQATFAARRGCQGPRLLLNAAQQLAPFDPDGARHTYADAFVAAFFVGRLAADVNPTTIATAVRSGPSSAQPNLSDRVLDGCADLYVDGPSKAAPVLIEALDELCADTAYENQHLRSLPLASAAAMNVWDDHAWDVLAARHLQSARETGTVGELPPALTCAVLVSILKGDLASAAVLVDETKTVIEMAQFGPSPAGAVALAAWAGAQISPDAIAKAELHRLASGGAGIATTVLNWAESVEANGRGHYFDAVVAAERATDSPGELGVRCWAMAELIEAASRTNMSELAAEALAELASLTQATATDWGRGIEARCRAMLSPDTDAEGFYREAIERLDRTVIRVESARARLVYGEWLRRQGRRIDAREQLRAAHAMFADNGFMGFAERARRELGATGETPRRRSDEGPRGLTVQESRIARLAADGLTNPEIGTELFISPRTVEWHLGKIFAELGVTSRRQLRDALPQ